MNSNSYKSGVDKYNFYLQEQNVFANWIRNGLITISLGVLVFLSTDNNTTKWSRIGFRIISVFFLSSGVLIFFVSFSEYKRGIYRLKDVKEQTFYVTIYLLIISIISLTSAVFQFFIE